MIARLVIVLVIAASVARADDKPWAAGITADRQTKALAIYQEGNVFFERSQFKEALAKYEQALPIWPHPAIHYNAAVCLINLDRPAEAYEHLEQALRFGSAPLGAELFEQGQTYEHRLERQLGQLEVTCTEAGAQVQLDGKPLLSCPGSATRRLPAGEHVIVADKPGFEPFSHRVTLDAGNRAAVPVELHRIAIATGSIKRRFPPWLPWTVVSGGAAIGLAGAVALVTASRLYGNYGHEYTRLCPTGCPQGDVDHPKTDAMIANQNRLAKADRDKWLGYGLTAASVAGVATGFLLLYLNQGKVERRPTIAPAVGPDRVGVIISGPW